MTAAFRASLRAALAGALLGCAAGSIPAGEIPLGSIAFLYRTPEEGRRRAEILAGGGAAPSRSGVARLESLGSLLGGGRDPGDELREFAGRLALLDPKTGQVRTLDAVPRGSAPLAWSIERRRLLFTNARHGPAQLFELDVASGDVRRLTRGPAIHPSGCYGGGGLVAYTEARPDASSVRIMVRRPGDRGARPLTPGPFDHDPSCSPDENALIYVASDAAGRAQLMRISTDGGEPRRIGLGRDPSFTPDGAWVVYSAHVRGRWRLQRMRPNGTGKTTLGVGVTDEFGPSVSPDGRYVVFASEEDGRESLFLRRFDGAKQRVLFSRGDGAHPVWIPSEEWSSR